MMALFCDVMTTDKVVDTVRRGAATKAAAE
jgi:hypothetical protein